MLTILGLLILDGNKASSSDLMGRASVIDADTLEIHGKRIRIWGLDAPENDQLCRDEEGRLYRCGAEAANQLYEHISGGPLACTQISYDRYRRIVATCTLTGDDVGEWLVAQGLAVDWPKYSNGRYARAQQSAERAARGIWRGSFAEPWLYRACLKASKDTTKCSNND
ncbi:endonuclease YncB(thermonuclease family) [Bradyrhizobium sp. USDA 4354]